MYNSCCGFAALGCPTLTSPREGWIAVGRRTATVGCNSTGEEYKLTCDGRQWSGPLPNCSVHGGKPSTLYRCKYQSWRRRTRATPHARSVDDRAVYRAVRRVWSTGDSRRSMVTAPAWPRLPSLRGVVNNSPTTVVCLYRAWQRCVCRGQVF